MPRSKAQFKRGSSILPKLTQPVAFKNKFPTHCDTCGTKQGIGQVMMSADPGDKKWTAECDQCATIKEAAQEQSDKEWNSVPAMRIPEDYDGDYHGRR
jgi:hypothetical protein